MIEQIGKDECIIELPFTSEIINIRDLTLYIQSELNSIKRNVTDSVLQALSTCIYQQLDKQSQIFFLLRLVLNESYFSYLSQRKKKLDLTELNMEEILNAYIGKIKRNFLDKKNKKYYFILKIIVNENSVQKYVLLYLIISVHLNQQFMNLNYLIYYQVIMIFFWNLFKKIYQNVYVFHHHYGLLLNMH
jgi:hypothetical protein